MIMNELIKETVVCHIKKHFPLIVTRYHSIKLLWENTKNRKRSKESIFLEIYRKNLWSNKESYSGPGSDLEHTVVIRKRLPALIKDFRVSSILDIPCGDFHWMKEVELSNASYIGADIVNDIIARNAQLFSNERRTFIQLDITCDALPKVDLILCRDLFVHFPNDVIARALNKIKESRSGYLLTTSHSLVTQNCDISTGGFRPINLLLPPFCFPSPIMVIYGDMVGKIDTGRNLSLWKVSDL